MSYANRIVALILGLGATAVGRATLPVFSRIQEDAQQLYKVALRWAGILFLVGFVGVLAGWFLAPWGVKLLFERGEFTAQNTEIVTDVFRYSLMQVPFYFVWVVLSSLLGSQRKYRELAIVSGINLFAKVIANFALVPLFNVNGIVLGTAFMYMMAMLLCLVVIQRTQFIDTQTSNKTV
jgi:peptidoglycan biosynthesis protein MviN/MurJ (putative lipid II flippase)